MDKVEWCEEFRPDREVHIAGIFLHDGLQRLSHCRRLDNVDEIFSILYHLSVVCERLLKVVIVPTEHQDDSDKKYFEQRLVTHNTKALLQRVQKAHALNISRLLPSVGGPSAVRKKPQSGLPR